MRIHRPSPSMIVALIALVVALGGTAIAAGGLINGSKIKNGSIAGKKLKKHTLTGKQINAKKLGKVPAATNADHATSAGDASTLGGIAPSGFVQGTGQTFSFSEQLNPGTAAAKAFTIPTVGDVSIGCDASSQTIITVANATGQSVDDSASFVSGGGAGGAVSIGLTVDANSPVVTLNGVPLVQAHYMLAWPSGTHDHSADIDFGYYSTPANKCAVLISGVVH